MSVIETNKIDLIGTDKLTGEVILTVSDHLDWNDVTFHLETLQSKLNSYLEFIEGGQIYESYPSAQGKIIVIEIVAKYSYPESGLNFISDVEPIVASIGSSIRLKVHQ